MRHKKIIYALLLILTIAYLINPIFIPLLILVAIALYNVFIFVLETVPHNQGRPKFWRIAIFAICVFISFIIAFVYYLSGHK